VLIEVSDKWAIDNDYISEHDYKEFMGRKYQLKWTTNRDTALIVTLLAQERSILEVGTYLGHTTQNIATAIPNASVVTIDVTKDIVQTLPFQTHEILSNEDSGSFITAPNVQQFKIESDDFFAANSTGFGGVFIDGDHSEAQVMKDSISACKLVEKNAGIVVWHDVYPENCQEYKTNPGVVNVLKALPYKCYKFENSWVGFSILEEI